MDSAANTSNDSNHGSTTSKQDANKKQQFTRKQRMDMYAWCVLELELHGHTVSIKKQQQAIKKLLKKSQDQSKGSTKNDDKVAGQNGSVHLEASGQLGPQGNETNQADYQQLSDLCNSSMTTAYPPTSALSTFTQIENHDQNLNQNHDHQHHHHYQETHNGQMVSELEPSALQVPPTSANGLSSQSSSELASSEHNGHGSSISTSSSSGGACINGGDTASSLPNGSGESAKKARKKDSDVDEDAKTLLQLQQEIATSQRCYSDYQKTQVLTSKMLKEVQKRFAKYYPDSPCPSRTTIKHVFIKCVEHGSVDNVKNPRKAVKIPNGDEVEYLLTHEPQMSLRQMARELNVSIGTVSRRCRALGLVPESVTLKHQQMASARRQKQIKQLDAKTRGSGAKGRGAGSSRSK